MQKLQTLPITTANFSSIREKDLLYVDKTQVIYNIAKQDQKYFLYRPRRFGKSLTISTLDALFRGKKEFFKGLWIEDKWNWNPRPVLRLNFSLIGDFYDKDKFLFNMNQILLEAVLNDLGISLESSSDWDNNFRKILSHLKRIGSPAILIDEYEYPLLTCYENKALQEQVQSSLKQFYTILKGYEIDFVFITGITKFSSTSIFSGMNDIEDISFSPEAATLCGVTQEELEHYFKHYIKELMKTNNLTYEKIMFQLKETYNGYQFSSYEKTPKVYNPFSLINCFKKNSIAHYWFSTGTPTILWKLFEKKDYDLSILKNPFLFESSLNESVSLDKIDLVQLLYQTGYLTIDRVETAEEHKQETTSKKLFLRFPNKEVEIGFYNALAEHLTFNKESSFVPNLATQLKQNLLSNDLNKFFNSWQQILSSIPYNLSIPQEKYYHSLLIVFARLARLNVINEQMTSDGRIDMVIELSDKIYILEFKLNKKGDDALHQIESKEYYLSLQLKDKPIILVGVSFDSETRKVANWISKELLSH